MRMLRIAQPPLTRSFPACHREVWAGLPEAARRRALTLLAQMIARGVLDTGVQGEES